MPRLSLEFFRLNKYQIHQVNKQNTESPLHQYKCAPFTYVWESSLVVLLSPKTSGGTAVEDGRQNRGPLGSPPPSTAPLVCPVPPLQCLAPLKMTFQWVQSPQPQAEPNKTQCVPPVRASQQALAFSLWIVTLRNHYNSIPPLTRLFCPFMIFFYRGYITT